MSAPILVVDDDEFFLEFTRTILEGAGHEVVASTDPLEALPLIEKHRPRLAVLDFNMPGMDGLRLLALIREKRRLPVIMLTLADRAELAMRSVRLGAFDFLTKPVNPERLLDVVGQALAAPSEEDDPRRVARFELLREIGRGGMGVVHEARDPHLDRKVALKVLLPDFAANPAYELRFLQEARSAARFSHPRIVTLYEAGRHRGRLYLAMELLQGRTLAQSVESSGPLSSADAVRLVARAADALAVMHERRLCHMDLKPANLMLTSDGEIKILDFGLARPAVDVQPARGDEFTDVFGTLPYMAPETIDGSGPSPAADIYALGLVLFELLSGRRAFRGSSPVETGSLIFKGRVPWEALPPIPSALGELLRRMVAVEPAARPASMKDVVAGLA